MGLAGPTNQKWPTDHPVQLSQQAVDIASLTMPYLLDVMNPVLDQFIRSDFPYPNDACQLQLHVVVSS